MCEIKNLKELQKQEAIKRLKLLKLLPEVIKDFEKNNRVYYSERQNKIFDGILYEVNQNPEFKRIIKEFEEKKNAIVYHAQLTRFEFGLCLSLLFVSEDEEEWEFEIEELTPDENKIMYPIAYCINLDNPDFSEYGTIGIKSLNGGISRVY